MHRPYKNTEFLPISQLEHYQDKNKYFCSAIVFSPETENDHFEGCPPYIELNHVHPFEEDEPIYFKVPEIVAYYGKIHAGYTMEGKRNSKKQGEKDMANKIKNLLDFK